MRHTILDSLGAMLLRPLVDLLAPPSCLACRCPPGAAGVLCSACRAAFEFLGSATCSRCALPQPCGSPCPARRLAFASAWAPVAYGGPAAALVLGLKERGVVAAASVMAGQIAALAPPELWSDGAVLVPVPGEPLRRRRRGVDHASTIAADLARRRGLPVARVLRRRVSPHARPARAGRAERLRESRLAIDVRGEPPAIAVLVDDVHTTGATLDVCARTLLLRGTRTVCAVTYARTLPMGRFGRTLGGT